MDNNNENKKIKKPGRTGLIVFLIAFVLPQLIAAVDEFDFDYLLWRLRHWAFQLGIDPELLPVIGAGIVVLIVLLIAAGKRRKSVEDKPVRNDRAGRTSAAAQRPDPRNRSFTPPEPKCIVCDHTGEDHFLRDKQQRIAQLDEWLKNGLIDREEYRVLKSRYERDL